jgi:ketosteroid isomerase-like protein
MFIAIVVLGSGCGASSPDDEVRSTVEGFAAAIADRDYQALCDRYFSTPLVTGLERAGLPCEAAIRPQIGTTRKPTLEIRSIAVTGDRARVRVHTEAANQPPSDDTLALARERDGWRIASLAEAGPQPLGP